MTVMLPEGEAVTRRSCFQGGGKLFCCWAHRSAIYRRRLTFDKHLKQTHLKNPWTIPLK